MGFRERSIFSESIHIRSCRARPGPGGCRISTNILTQPWTGAKWGRGGRDLGRRYGSSFQEQIPRTNFQNDKGDRATSDQRTDVARPRFVMSFQKTRGCPFFTPLRHGHRPAEEGWWWHVVCVSVRLKKLCMERSAKVRR